MDDYISRRDLLNNLEELEEEWEDACVRPDYYDAKRAIKNAKSVQMPEKVCEWEPASHAGEWKSGCKLAIYNLIGVSMFKKCPYCGGDLKRKVMSK